MTARQSMGKERTASHSDVCLLQGGKYNVQVHWGGGGLVASVRTRRAQSPEFESRDELAPFL